LGSSRQPAVGDEPADHPLRVLIASSKEHVERLARDLALPEGADKRGVERALTTRVPGARSAISWAADPASSCSGVNEEKSQSHPMATGEQPGPDATRHVAGADGRDLHAVAIDRRLDQDVQP
jgi:hypothetical protein